MYELFILGELLDQPMHGYVMRDVINLAFGPIRQISWGSLYPLIRRLEADKLITQIEAADEPAKARRKTYTITEAGKQRFFFLMLRPEEYSTDYPELIGVKLVNFDHISAEQRVEILRHYRTYLQYVSDRLTEGSSFVSGLEKIPDAERSLILRNIERRRLLNRADLTWIEAQITEFAAGEAKE